MCWTEVVKEWKMDKARAELEWLVWTVQRQKAEEYVQGQWIEHNGQDMLGQ